LREVNQFENTSIRFLKRLLSYTELVTFKRHEFLFKESERAQCAYIIKEGHIQVQRTIYVPKTTNYEQ